MKLFLSLFFSLTFMVCNSQNEKPNREAFKLNIAVNLKQDYGMEVTQTPYFVKSKTLQIYPGEKVLIEAEIKADSIFSMKSVKENLHPEKTIEVEFLQDAKDRNNISMFLNVKNPFDKTAWYTTFDQNIILIKKTLTKAPYSAIGGAPRRDPLRPTAPCIYKVKEEQLKEQQQTEEAAAVSSKSSISKSSPI